MKKSYIFIFIFLAFSYQASSQCFNGGTGSDGAFVSSGNQTLPNNTYNFTSVTINTGDTITFSDTNAITIFCQGAMIIDGGINVSGAYGENSDNGLVPGNGGAGGPGGFAGGRGGGAIDNPPYHGLDGLGLGAGIAGQTADINEGMGGGGAGYATIGGFAQDSANGFGVGGPIYGNALISPFVGGSGGGGGAADDDGGGGADDGGAGGGGGGGALRIVAFTINISGTGFILADGGFGGSTGNGGSGGGGSGGAIWIKTTNLSNDGNVSAIGGGSLVNQYPSSIGGTGSDGRILIETDTITGAGTITPTENQIPYVGPAVDVTVTNTDPTLTSNSTSATAWQWLDCGTMTLITGETNQSYTATTNGSYAVIVTEGSCSDTSLCIAIVSVGIGEIAGSSISVSPNPTNDYVTVDFGNHKTAIKYSISTVEGRIVKQEENVLGNKITINLSNESRGIYFLKIEDATSTAVYKIIKK
jgi:hypothetical protein